MKESFFLDKNLSSKNRLGRGLDSLLGPSREASSQTCLIDIEKISPNNEQPRTRFEKEKLKELSLSIKNNGLLQPILVQAKGEHYQIIAGERRWRACIEAGLHKVPAIIKTPKPDQAPIWALLENLQRQDLNPMEQARAFKAILNKRDISQEELANQLGLKRSSLANQLRLLQLDKQVQSYVEEGRISFSQAREILKVEDLKAQRQIAEQCLKESLSVKALSSKIQNSQASQSVKHLENPTWLASSLKQLQHRLQSRVQVRFSSTNKGKISIPFNSEKQLKTFLDYLWENKK